MEDYCNYWSEEWCKRYDGLRNVHYKVKIVGNTLYVIHQAAKREAVYKKLFGNIYRKTNRFERTEDAICTLVMCNMKESTIVDVLKSFGFEVKGD